MGYLFTCESVSAGHPDKVADQISDAILDEFLRQDPTSKVACETLCTTGLVVVSGEVKSSAYVDVQNTVRGVINDIGYTRGELKFEGNSCGVISAIHEQSPDINQGVEREDPMEQGAGDQGIMFGYACGETTDYMPAALILSHMILKELEILRSKGKEMTYLRPDSKSQVTIEYQDDNTPVRVHTIVVSTQHDEWVSVEQIRADVLNIVMPRLKKKLKESGDHLLDLIQDDYILHVNPTGKFVIGGPHGDTGLTGRKIIVDTYGGKASHGGGAFSGKDSSKVDRSAAYAARYIAKNMVAAGVADQMLIQVAYAIGIARPVSVFVNTFGSARVDMTDGQIAVVVDRLFDLRPASIVSRFGLTNPIFRETAAYGHFGRTPFVRRVEMMRDGVVQAQDVEFFGWEKLDSVDLIRGEFGL